MSMRYVATLALLMAVIWVAMAVGLAMTHHPATRSDWLACFLYPPLAFAAATGLHAIVRRRERRRFERSARLSR